MGESLFASTEQPVYRLSPHLLRRGGFRRGCGAPSLRVKKGTGDDFRKNLSYQERTGEIEPLVPEAPRLQSLISH